MGCGFVRHCLTCGVEINEFTDIEGFMQCPRAYDAYDVISKLLPEYPTREKCEHAMNILKEGGYDMHAWRGSNSTRWSPEIPIIAELATRLMKYEEVNGARYHESGIICKTCVEDLRHCAACGNDHKPACPICRTNLVPYK